MRAGSFDVDVERNEDLHEMFQGKGIGDDQIAEDTLTSSVPGSSGVRAEEENLEEPRSAMSQQEQRSWLHTSTSFDLK